MISIENKEKLQWCRDCTPLYNCFALSKQSITEWNIFCIEGVPNMTYKLVSSVSKKEVYIGATTLDIYVKDKEYSEFIGADSEFVAMYELDDAEAYIPVAKREKWYLSLYKECPIYEPAEGGYYYAGVAHDSYDEYVSWEEAVKAYNQAFEEEEEGTVYKSGLFIRETKQALIGEAEFLVLESELGSHETG